LVRSDDCDLRDSRGVLVFGRHVDDGFGMECGVRWRWLWMRGERSGLRGRYLGCGRSGLL
jgi:hypothetical protein